ncbi:hypothetical protein V1509DRAFT_103010 [Lipomyces kononenkoae]
MVVADATTVADINLLAEYLSDQLHDLPSSPSVDCIVLCASAVLYGAEYLFQVLEQRPSLTKSLVLCGGIGHSTQSMYDAVAQHPRFCLLADDIHGLPEARILEKILAKFFDRSAIASEGCQILVEDQSTNCGQNASLSRKVLEGAGIQTPMTCIVIQDPTMMLRTTASFKKVYEDMPSPPMFISCPVFVPQMQVSKDGMLKYQGLMPSAALWPHPRFFELIMGEIPRLRDNEEGYGPKGRGFIAHVEVPAHIEAAWSRLRAVLNTVR